MAVHLWAIGEAQGSKPLKSDSDAVGYIAGLSTWFLASGVLIAVKATTGQVPPWTFVFLRVSLATLVLVPLVWARRRDIRDFIRRRGLEAFVIGGLGLGLTQGLLFAALNYTSAINVGIINSTVPLLTMVLAAFVLREVLTPWQILGAIVAFAGVLLTAAEGSLKTILALDLGTGDFIAMLAGCAFAGYTVFLKRAKFELDRLPLLVVLMCGGVIASFPFFAYELIDGQHEEINVNGYLALGYTVTFGAALMYLCYNWSIDVLGASRAGTLLYSEMVFTAILAWLILGEAIEWYHYVGAGLIVVGIVLVSALKRRDTAVEE